MPAALEARLGPLLLAAGWYAGEIPALLDVTLLVVWPGKGVTVFALKVVQFCVVIAWNL